MSLFSVIGLSVVLHLYIGLRISPELGSTAAAALALQLLASVVCVPLGLTARRFARSDRIAWIGLLFLGLFSFLLVLTFLRDVSLLLSWLAHLAWGVDVAAWRRLSAQAVPVLAILASLLGLLNARRTAQVRRVEISIAGLEPALDGFRIVQISDVHVGPTIKKAYLQKVVDRINALQPDAVAITGDLVDGSVANLAAHVAPLAGLRSRHGSFFVTGNHEYYSGAPAWIAYLRQLGVQVLLNAHRVIEHRGAQMVLAGITDYGAAHFDARQRSDPHAALAGAPAGVPRILLAHQPRSAAAAAAAGFDVQLSGHTHGGQFLPWNFFVPLQQPFTAGLHRMGKLWVYVSRGTGYWGPPMRVGAPSEITEVILRPA